MLHYLFIGATWLIGSLGVGGAIAAIAAAVYLGPSAAMAILEPLCAKFIACTKCVVAVACVLATVGAYWVGHHTAENSCHADERNSELIAQRQDTLNAQKAAADEANRAIDIEVSASDQHKKDLAYIAALNQRPDNCPFDGASPDGLPGARPAAAKPSRGTKPADKASRSPASR